MNRIKALMLATALALAPTLLMATPQPARGVAGPAFTIETTVMVDDGSDSCATENHIVVDAGTTFRICYTMTNTGTEALIGHGVWDTRFGWVAGPGDATVVEPGESWSFTATGANMVSMFHKVTWNAAGADSGTEVEVTDWVYITIEGGAAQLDMTVMVDDGTDTCGTATELTIPAGTQVRLCYTMTNTFTEALDQHLLVDEHLGSLLISLISPIDVGESLVHSEVAVIQEAATWISSWEAIGVDTDANTLAIDSVRFEIGDATTEPCVTTLPTTTGRPPTTTEPPTTSTTTTTPTSTTTATSTTTTTQPFLDTTTTSTTSPVIVLFTTTTTLGEPAGFARRPHAAEPCPEPPGGTLPPTGSPAPMQAALALGLVALGSVALITTRRRRT